MRMGIGYDIHPLVRGRKLILGGEELEFPLGLMGYSDADVLCHALGDALLGAAGLGDIGRHFPDTDEAYRGISSLKLLEEIARLVRAAEYEIINVDVTVVLQKPHLAEHRVLMEKNISRALLLELDRVNIKATTNEGLDAIGKGEAIAALAIAGLEVKKISPQPF